MQSSFPIHISVIDFLSSYDEEISTRALLLRDVILKTLPEIQEVVDQPAKMIAYTYGPKYVDMICTLIPSKKGLKLGFYKGNELPDPEGLLEGTGKISRYVQIKNTSQIKSSGIKKLLLKALEAYKKRTPPGF